MQNLAGAPARPVSRTLPLFLSILSLPALALAQTDSTVAADNTSAELLHKRFDPVEFCQRHLSPYEPIYIVIGGEAPNVKFQFGFKFQLLLGAETEWQSGFHAAFTQTSLWNTSAPSAPFLDSSYKPELFYLWRRALGGRSDDGWRLDLQLGAQHESNGKGGVDSRSLNIAYLRPTLTLGDTAGWNFTLQPRFWSYLGDLSDNPDLDEYRGYFDLRAALAWREIQLAALGRMGKDGQNHSVQLDLTWRFPGTAFYVDVQYYTGYGEALLNYRKRSDVIRAGISLYR